MKKLIIIIFACFLLSAEMTHAALDLVAHYPFNGDSNDVSGNLNHGVEEGGVSYLVGAIEEALYLDGQDGCVSGDFPDIKDITNTFTVTFWALPSDVHEIDAENTSGTKGVTGQKYAIGPGYGGSWGPDHAGAGISVGTNGVSVYEHAASYLPPLLVWVAPTLLNDWTHIAVVYSNKQPSLYINGVRAKTGLTSPKSYVHPGPANSWIGKHGSYGSFRGSLDDLRIYSSALSDSEIHDLYNIDLDGDGILNAEDNCPINYNPDQIQSYADGVMAYYPFNGSAEDVSGNMNHGVEEGVLTYIDSSIGPAVYFDGQSSSIAGPNCLKRITNTFTMAFWAYPSDAHEIDAEKTSGTKGVAGQRYAIGPGYGGAWGPDHAGVGISVGTNGVSVYEHAASYLPPLLVWETPVGQPIDTWTHIAVVYQDKVPSLYVNGELRKKGLTSPKLYIHPGPAHSWVGKHDTYGNYRGFLDELRIYDRALTAFEIHDLTIVDHDGDGIPNDYDVFPDDPAEWEDADSDGTGDNADNDDDNDGMLDVWENSYAGLDPFVNDSGGDLDGDGFSNLDEFQAGSNPLDPNSIPNRPPSVPTLISPPNNDNTINAHNVTLKWEPSTDPDNDTIEYYVMVTEVVPLAQRTMANSGDEGVLTLDTFYTLPFSLELGKTYQWAVRARDKNGNWSAVSELWSFTIGSDEVVEIVNVSSGKPYELTDAELGARPYIDRDYRITNISFYLDGGVLVRTANNDNRIKAEEHLTLGLHKEAVVYVCYDKRGARNPPSWLKDEGWERTYESIKTTNRRASPMVVFRKVVTAGLEINLGGNHSRGGKRARSNYFVVVQPTAKKLADIGDLSAYVLYADCEVRMEEIADSQGNVGSNKEIEIEHGGSGTLEGDLRALGKIEVEGSITIDGNVITNDEVEVGGSLFVTGTVTEGGGHSPIVLPRPCFTTSGPNLTVWEKGSKSLQPGGYGRVRVKKQATLYLSSGEYYMEKFEIDDRAIVVIEGPVTINVLKRLDIDKHAEIQISSGTTRDVTINVQYDRVIHLDKHSKFRGTLIAPNSKVKFEDGSGLEGAVYARKISLEEGVSFQPHPK